MRTRATQSNRQTSASVLIIVLWIAFGMVSIALYFGQSMTFELRAADNRVAAIESDQIINGAVRYVSYVLTQQTNGRAPDPTLYQREAVEVGDGKFWLIGRDTNQIVPDKVYFGLIDEASKLNLNNVTSNMLMNLPFMTENLAAAIIDWKRTSTEASEGGAKDETYGRLTPAYLCKNGKYETVEELRMVYGVDKNLLYGEDANLNGVLDANENDGEESEPFDNRDSKLDPGLWEYFTVYSYESTNRTDGTGKLNINSAQQLTQIQTLMTDQSIASATAVMAAIKAKISPTAPPGGKGAAAPATPFTNMVDLYITATTAGMTADEFALIAGDIYIPTTNSPARGPVVGPVNINTACEAVLACIPGIGITNSALVVQYRQSTAGTSLATVGWLVDAIGTSAARTAGAYITVNSYQFTADIAAVGHYGHGYHRVRFVFDVADSLAGTSPPRIMYRQDLTHLGWALGKQTRQNLMLAKDNR